MDRSLTTQALSLSRSEGKASQAGRQASLLFSRENHQVYVYLCVCVCVLYVYPDWKAKVISIKVIRF